VSDFKEFGDDSSITMIEFVYDFINNKYGLQKVAEKKFYSLLAGCVQFKKVNSRIRLFGRFLSLYEELTLQDLRFYFEIVDHTNRLVLNFLIQENDELPLVPTVSTLFLQISKRLNLSHNLIITFRFLAKGNRDF